MRWRRKLVEKVKLTKTSVDDAAVPAEGEARLWDKELTGFCLRVYKGGRRVYAVKYRVNGRQRWHTIGPHGVPWTPDTARAEAKKVIGLAAGGVDHTEVRREQRTAPLVKELIDRYLEEGPATRPAKRASSWKADKGNLTHHVKPLIGEKVVKDLSRSDIARMIKAVSDGATAQAATKTTKLRGRARVRGGPGIAGRVLASVRAMFGWGIEHGVGKVNPASGIKLPRRAAQERFLSAEEVERALSALAALVAEGKVPIAHDAVIRLLMLTGARKMEIVGLRRSEIDTPRKRLVLPPERSKAGGKTGERRIALGEAALAILAAQPKGDGALVFPSAKEGVPTSGVQKSWELVRARAELPGVRLHDLRHSFASFAVAGGASLFLVARPWGTPIRAPRSATRT